MTFVKLYGRGQLTIPQELREQARIEPGDYVEIVANGPGRLEIRAISPYRITELIERDRQPISIDVESALKDAEEAEAEELSNEIQRSATERVGA